MKHTYLIIFLFTILSNAQTKNVFDISRKGSLDEIKLMYKHNPDIINTVDENNSSPLILASYRGNTKIALFLADKVKDLNYNSGMGTALMAAVMSGDIAIISKLISLKANLNSLDSQGKTALIYAVFFNKNEIVKLLINAGANLTIKGNDGKSSRDFAESNKNTELIILLNN